MSFGPIVRSQPYRERRGAMATMPQPDGTIILPAMPPEDSPGWGPWVVKIARTIPQRLWIELDRGANAERRGSPGRPDPRKMLAKARGKSSSARSGIN